MKKEIILPEKFRNTVENFPDFDFESFRESLSDPLPAGIRINEAKIEKEFIESYLPIHSRTPWCKTGFYLSERPRFMFDPLWHAGAYYVQEASSMFVEQCFLHAKRNTSVRRILDLCAAPGGKSTHLASLMPADGLLIGNEVIRTRTGILAENIAKWGLPGTFVTSNDPKDFGRLDNFFDLVWIDAPCSGEGMFRKEPKARSEWSPENVTRCAARQSRILNDVWNSLRPGGYLGYSTCTYNTVENEGVIADFLSDARAESIKIDVDKSWNITESEIYGIHTYRFYPHKIKGEGFCCTLVRKPEDEFESVRLKKYKLPAYQDNLNGRLKNDYFFFLKNDNVYAVKSDLTAEFEHLFGYLYFVSPGINVAEIKNRPIPSADSALSSDLNTGVFESRDVDTETALTFLRRESVSLPPDTPKGYVLITYRDIPLGWIKNLGNRSNNLLPVRRRIPERP